MTRCALAFGLLVGACASTQVPTADLAKETAMTPSKTEQVRQLLKSIESGDSGPVAYINPSLYTQHNLDVGDGLAGFGEALSQLPRGSALRQDGPCLPRW
ncbi:MAG: hypothetical protein ACI9MR_003155 [Myxococcota bacterium]|jgi:hypothetical protein